MGSFEAFLKTRCPRCRQGDMFKSWAYDPKGFQKMHKKCPNCGLQFEREPGFFIGAMYVNYAFTIAIIVAVAVALNVLGLYSLMAFATTFIIMIILLLPILFRYSRVLYLYLFGGVKYNPELDVRVPGR